MTRHYSTKPLAPAVDEELGACFFEIMPGDVEPFKAEFGVPEEYAPIGPVTVGHRADLEPQDPRFAADRRPVQEVVHRGQWGRR